MNRSADWLHQAQADLAQASLSAGAGHHEWACFASHQAVEKALKALHLQQGSVMPYCHASMFEESMSQDGVLLLGDSLGR